MRAHPPLLEVSDDVSIDDELGSNPDQNLVIQIPRSLESLFAVAPLSYYLGASIRVSHDVTPVIKFDSLVYQFPGANTFAEEVAAIMTRVFYLDCLVRNAGPYGFEIHELDLLDRLPLDTERLYGLSMSKRLKAYLDVPFDDVAECFPEWPLAVSMDSKVDNIPALPHLLDRLSLIFPPESKPIDERTIVERSLNDFRRSSTNDRCNTDDHRTEKIVPELRYGNVHGWMADGLPVDAFKCPPEAFSNRLDYLDQSHPFSVAVILNDVDMDAEFSKVVTTYQSRADTFSIDVDVMYKLCTDELATLFRSSYDFVHYIGHCDPEGLRCHDGHLSVSDIPEVSVQSFFLNACRSYEEGLDLIRRGSVAGAVTIGDVLDEQARKVGTTFARLMGRGYSIEQSLRLSRARAIMNRQYGVVGDGTHVLTQGISSPPPILSLKKTTGGHYLLSSNCNSPNFHGSIYRLKTAPKPLILGNQTPHAVTERELKAVLRESEEPVIYNDKLYWSDELLEELF